MHSPKGFKLPILPVVFFGYRKTFIAGLLKVGRDHPGAIQKSHTSLNHSCSYSPEKVRFLAVFWVWARGRNQSHSRRYPSLLGTQAGLRKIEPCLRCTARQKGSLYERISSTKISFLCFKREDGGNVSNSESTDISESEPSE